MEHEVRFHWMKNSLEGGQFSCCKAKGHCHDLAEEKDNCSTWEVIRGAAPPGVTHLDLLTTSKIEEELLKQQ